MVTVLGVVTVSVSREARFRKISQIDRPDRSSQNERRSPSSSKNLILLVESEHRELSMLASGSHGREEYPCRHFVSYRVSWKQLRLVSIARPPPTILSPCPFFSFVLSLPFLPCDRSTLRFRLPATRFVGTRGE